MLQKLHLSLMTKYFIFRHTGLLHVMYLKHLLEIKESKEINTWLEMLFMLCRWPLSQIYASTSNAIYLILSYLEVAKHRGINKDKQKRIMSIRYTPARHWYLFNPPQNDTMENRRRLNMNSEWNGGWNTDIHFTLRANCRTSSPPCSILWYVIF